MRFVLIAILVISVVLLIAGNCDGKKSHSHRKKRSNEINSSISDKKYRDNKAGKYHDKSYQKKRSLSDDMNIDDPTLNEQNQKHRKLRHHKKYEDEEMVSSDERKIKNGHKHKCEHNGEKHGKCKKNRKQEFSIQNTDNTHNDDDRSTLSKASEASASNINNQKKKEKNKKKYENNKMENSPDNSNTKKHNQSNKNLKNPKKSQSDVKKKYKPKSETLSDVDADINHQQNEEKTPVQKKSGDSSESRSTRSVKLNREKQNDEEEEEENKDDDESVLQEVESKERKVRSSSGFDPMEEQVDEQVHGYNVPEICVTEIANDNEDTLDESCKH